MKRQLSMVVVLGLMLSACSKPVPVATESSASPTPIATSVPTSTTSGTPTDMMGKEKAFTVVGNNFDFDVKEIKVKKGDTVKITFKNLEGFHDWRIDEFNAFTKQIGANNEDVISFVADKSGTFEYYCSVGQHRSMGMVGKLIVE